MNRTSLLNVLWRQRRVVIPAALLCALLPVFIVLNSPPTYRASGSVVLLNPPDLPDAQMGGERIPDEWQNPYTRIGSLSVVVDIIGRVVVSDPVMQRLVESGLSGVPEVAGNRDYYSGPIIDVASEASSADAAIADVNLLIDEVGNQLLAMQDRQGTDPQYYIRTETVITPDRATTVFSGTLRLLIVGTALSVAVVVAIGLLADKLRSRKSSLALVDNRLVPVVTPTSTSDNQPRQSAPRQPASAELPRPSIASTARPVSGGSSNTSTRRTSPGPRAQLQGRRRPPAEHSTPNTVDTAVPPLTADVAR